MKEGSGLSTARLRQLWKNEYFQTVIMILLILVVVFGFWYGSQLILGTSYPALAVASGSMCKEQGALCDGWSHPFEPTLHKGDLIVVQGIDPKELTVGTIIVFHKPMSSSSDADELIVHRIYTVENNTSNGLVYFETKGDANPSTDPFDFDYRGENYTWHDKISEKLVVGRVIMRIPWVGHVALSMRNSFGIFLIAILIIIIVILEFVIPAVTHKESEEERKEEETSTSSV
jgi:signal peptidase I